MATGDRLNGTAAQEVKDKLITGKAVSGNEVLAAAAVEGPDGLPSSSVVSSAGPSGLPGINIPPFDYYELTYVAAGNGLGEIETIIYKTGGSGGVTVATITIAYNADDEILSVTKS